MKFLGGLKLGEVGIPLPLYENLSIEPSSNNLLITYYFTPLNFIGELRLENRSVECSCAGCATTNTPTYNCNEDYNLLYTRSSTSSMIALLYFTFP